MAEQVRAAKESDDEHIEYKNWATRTICRMAKQLDEQAALLKSYDNPHTPPSHRTATQKKMAAKKPSGPAPSGRKQGAQKGHPGRTSRPKPTEYKEHELSECPGCGSRDIAASGRRIRDVTEIPPPPRPVTTRHTINAYDCAGCGRRGMEPETGLPGAGLLGSNAVGRIAANFIDRMPHRMNARRMKGAGLPVSVGTINNVLARLGRNLSGQAAALVAVLICARVLHIDETSFRLNGKTVWVWIFLDPDTGSTLYVLRPSRGREVLREVLRGFRGVIVCDGWKSYLGWKLQRCWAHILREARYLLERHPRSAAARRMLEQLRRIYRLALEASGSRMSRARRARVRAALLGQVRRLAEECGVGVAAKFAGKLGRAADALFEFVLDPRISATNNAAERGLREIVVHRKIRGTLRSEGSMEVMGNIFTCAATWKNRGLDYIAEMQKYA